jgi:hypothetical protein
MDLVLFRTSPGALGCVADWCTHRGGAEPGPVEAAASAARSTASSLIRAANARSSPPTAGQPPKT